MSYSGSAPGLYTFKVMALIILLQQIRGVELIFQFPSIVHFRATFPFEEILKSFVLSKVSMTPDSFYFVLHFPIYQVRSVRLPRVFMVRLERGSKWR
jgi:hypothetical protein